MAKQAKSRFRQVAALPWRRRADGGVEVLLVTTRERQRWILPKGWRMRGKKDSEAAATEALEEAGLVGVPSPGPVGMFTYSKRFLKKTEAVDVDVYALEVARCLSEFREKGQRESRWVPPEAAADLVTDKGMAAVILDFCAGLAASAEAGTRASA